jgi:type I restriction enzyme R subunit
MKLDEQSFESFIGEWLFADAGYRAFKHGTSEKHKRDFDPVRGLDLVELFAFIAATQPDECDEVRKLHGGDPTLAQAKFLDRLCKEIESRGTVDVLRHGIIDLGVSIRLAYFRPAHSLTPSLLERYAANRVTVTRQLPYEVASNKTVDLALFVNGIPVATAELKNETTGQNIEEAKSQYRTERDAKNVTLSRRAIVHFAVDTQEAAMTTRLAGLGTVFFPFNRGNEGGPGNPANPDGHRTAYLWESVWQRDAWLDVLARFVHVQKPPKGSKKPPTMIFPRFHQWDAVLRLESAALAEGPGHDYLVQHSAGSGKSNTIAWLAHRLSTLHDAADHKVYDKVVVITDRRVLDRQLQDTIYQFEHKHGVVQKIEEGGVKSAKLADALAGAQARIVITTLQTFPFVLDKVGELPNRTYAVIVDEAHSSQTGESAKDLKLVLGGASSSEEELTKAELEDSGHAAEPVDPVEDALAEAAAARGKQSNLSFFAFTATPKGRTLEMFGRLNPHTKKHEPFHLYPMRQAVEEGFILDVLANYITYEIYWNIEKTIEEDPAYDTAKAKTAIGRFVSLHEHNVAQKAQIITEHFQTHVAHRIAGQAKAMVVTASRLHAVRYKLALDKYIKEHGDLGVLVAFSGTVYDGAAEWTESKMNGFPESQTAAEFDTGKYQILIGAEKFQTGFDQPLLYAMYVDKTLTGLAAVQTLSRLNRTHEGKDGTFVLDFRNDAEDIRKSFEPWYGKTVAPPTDPNLLYDTRHELDHFDVLRPDEVEKAIKLLLGRNNHGRVLGALAPAIDRFLALDLQKQESFRDALNRFVRTYSFLSQVVAFADTKLEREYLFCKALSSFVKPKTGGVLDLGEKVELTHLRLEQTFEGSISLTEEEGEVTTFFSGLGKQHVPEQEALSQIIARLNERFGTDWDPEDRLFFDTVAEKLIKRPDVQQKAAANDEENFGLVLSKEFMEGVVAQLGTSEDMTLKFINNEDLQQAVLEAYLPLIYGKSRVAHQEHCPIGELLGPDKESQSLEYKATLRTHAVSGEVYKPLETASLKTLAAFLNSSLGGTLLIGVDDYGSVIGLESDYASLRRTEKDDRDLFQLHLANICAAAFGAAAASNISSQVHVVEGHDAARVHVKPCGFPVEAEVMIDKNGQFQKKKAFYIRINNATVELDEDEKEKYVGSRWAAASS